MHRYACLSVMGALLLSACTTIPANDPAGDDTSGGDGTETSGAITGRISAPASTKPLAGRTTNEGFRVVAVSSQTLKAYSGDTDSTGAFSIDLPDSEFGGAFIFNVVGQDSKVLGPILFLNRSQSSASTGLQLGDAVSLGTIEVSDGAGSQSLQPGQDADLTGGSVAQDVITRLNDDGAPVGVPNIGKGDEAVGASSSDPAQQADRDQDGLVDVFDADDDGDGVIDDFDTDGPGNPAAADGVTLNFFMNLKLDDQQGQVYFNGDTAGIEDSLKTDTVITFEVRGEAGLNKTITGARIIGPPAPAPAYLSMATVQSPGGSGALWSSMDFALSPDVGENHFQAFIVPNDFINAGDTFAIELTFDDGTTKVYSRMINYVFKSIPKLVIAGAPGSVSTYNGGTLNFDGSQDLVLEWNPPVDELGQLILGQDYRFEIFYYDASGQQINDIDGAATFGTPPAGFNAQTRGFEVDGSNFTSTQPGGVLKATLPSEIFVDTVQTSGGPVAVASYKVDIAAQNNGNNAALMVRCVKQSQGGQSQ